MYAMFAGKTDPTLLQIPMYEVRRFTIFAFAETCPQIILNDVHPIRSFQEWQRSPNDKEKQTPKSEHFSFSVTDCLLIDMCNLDNWVPTFQQASISVTLISGSNQVMKSFVL